MKEKGLMACRSDIKRVKVDGSGKIDNYYCVRRVVSNANSDLLRQVLSNQDSSDSLDSQSDDFKDAE